MKSMRLACAVAAFVVMVGSVASAQQQGAAGLTGEIKGEAGEPLSGAMINILLQKGGVTQTKSDATGKWHVTGLTKGEWRAMFLAEGYATQIVKVQIAKDEQVTVPPVVMKKLQ
jgi:hypothetical protein